MLRLVAAKHQQVGDTQELKIQQDILRVLARKSAAQQVGDRSQSVFVLYGCRHSYRTRSASQALPLVESVAQFLIDILAPVGGDIDVFGVELAQEVYGGVQLLDACPLQRWKHLEGEGGMLVTVYQVYYFHWLCRLFSYSAMRP